MCYAKIYSSICKHNHNKYLKIWDSSDFECKMLIPYFVVALVQMSHSPPILSIKKKKENM